MKLQSLWDCHKGQDVYIVGTGPSMRVFPLSMLRGRVTIGLNQAWKYCKLTYCVTAHPELVVEYENYQASECGIRDSRHTTWVVKSKAPLHVTEDHPEYYAFDTKYASDRYRFVRSRVAGKLMSGGGIHTTAMNLAAHMGARTIIMLGIDLCQLDNEHHGHSQHVQLRGLSDKLYAMKYYTQAVRVRRIIQRELGIPVLSLTPLMGLRYAEVDYKAVKDELGLAPLPVPEERVRKAPNPARLTKEERYDARSQSEWSNVGDARTAGNGITAGHDGAGGTANASGSEAQDGPGSTSTQRSDVRPGAPATGRL